MRCLAVALVVLCGCDTIWRVDRLDPIPVDAADPDASGQSSSDCVFGASAPVGLFGTSAFDPSLSADRLELYVAVLGADFRIHRARRANRQEPFADAGEEPGVWVSGADIDPALMPDGQTLYFMSTRVDQNYRLYMARRALPAEPFVVQPGEVSLGGLFYKGFDISRDALRIYVSDEANELAVLTRTDTARAFGSPTPLGIVGAFPSIAGDELTIYYHRGATVYRMTRDTPGDLFANEQAIAEGGDADISDDGRTLVHRDDNGQLVIAECQ